MSPKLASTSLLALSLCLAACQDDGDVGANGELASRLSNPTTLAIVAPSHADIRGRDQDGTPVTVGPLAVEGGSIAVHADEHGNLVVSDFIVDLADVIADDGTLAGNPLTLTNVHVSLGRMLVLDNAWSKTGASARATVYSDLRLDWSMIDDSGATLPLGTQKIEDVEINLSLRVEDDGSISARLSSSLYGRVFGNWGVVLTDFQMDVNATDGV